MVDTPRLYLDPPTATMIASGPGMATRCKIRKTTRNGITYLTAADGSAQRLKRGLWTVHRRSFGGRLVKGEAAARRALC